MRNARCSGTHYGCECPVVDTSVGDGDEHFRAVAQALVEAEQRADAEKRRADEAEANARRSEAHCRRAEDVARAERAKVERLTAMLADVLFRRPALTQARFDEILAAANGSIHDNEPCPNCGSRGPCRCLDEQEGE